MTKDELEKLTPAKWEQDKDEPGHISGPCDWVKPSGRIAVCRTWNNTHDAAFIVLARNAFDVMLWRGWFAVQNLDKSWSVKCNTALLSPYDYAGSDGCKQTTRIISSEQPVFRDPFTALVTADEWFKENME